MQNQLLVFDSVLFDKEDKTFTIVNGSIGTYSYKNIKKCQILSEIAKFKGKSAPFDHVEVNGYSTTARLIQNDVYVGLKLVMNDKSVLAVYVSKEKVGVNTFQYRDDVVEAQKIKKIFDQCIRKYTQ